MNKKQSKIRFTLTLSVLIFFSSCNITKFVPEGKYLLDKVEIQSDTKSIEESEIKDYLRQTPNNKVLGLYRSQLGIYSLAPKDTASKWNKGWANRLKRLGEPPVIFDPELTDFSARQVQQLFKNRGFINAAVDTSVLLSNKRAEVTYTIQANKPYKLRNYSVETIHPLFDSVANDPTKTQIVAEMNFNTEVLNNERERITTQMRNLGFYNFLKDYIVFSADSALNSNQVDLHLDIRPNLKNNSDPINWQVFRQYYVGNVFFVTNRNTADSAHVSLKDTVSFRGYYLIDTPDPFISIDALVNNTYIEPGKIYQDHLVERTYTALNALDPVKYVNISFKPTEVPDVLDSYIYIFPAKTMSVSAEIKATLTKGFWGGALQIGGTEKNLLGGAESLLAELRVASEKQNVEWAREVGGQLRLKVPKFIFPFASYDFKRNMRANTEFSTLVSYQNRPNEFTTTNLNGSMGYSWTSSNNKYQHQLDVLNLSYIYFPKIADDFYNTYLSTGIYNKYNYENHFILRMGYSGSYSTFNAARPLRNYRVRSYSIESAGNLLSIANSVLGLPKDIDGNFNFFRVRFAQYVRAEFNNSHHFIFDNNNRIVTHSGIGIGLPYGNADIIPYERRFYAGGANSVRGWNESQLGPGNYNAITNVRSRDFNQVGDIKLDLNLEYRSKLFWRIEGALFFDAGNVWTIKNYNTVQPGGYFKLNEFYKQIAMSYGLGIRLDADFFILRLDMGVRLYDPVRTGTDAWRINPKINDDFALHVAIGYPF